MQCNALLLTSDLKGLRFASRYTDLLAKVADLRGQCRCLGEPRLCEFERLPTIVFHSLGCLGRVVKQPATVVKVRL